MIPLKLIFPMRCYAGAMASATLYDSAFLTPNGRIRVYDVIDAYHDDPAARALSIVLAESAGSGVFTIVQTVNLAADNHICLTGRRIVVPSGMYLGVRSTTATAAGRSLFLQAIFNEYAAEDVAPYGAVF